MATHELVSDECEPMTQATFDRLTLELAEAQRSLSNASLAIGEAAGSEGAWHDNAAYDQALIERDVAQARLNTLHTALQRATIIKPPADNTEVRVGSQVGVVYDGERDVVSYLILGRWDSDPKQGIISHDSPLGSALLGSSVGQIVQYTVGDNVYSIGIRTISPGNF